MATTGNLWSTSDKWGTSKGTRYYACPLSTLESALNNTAYVPSNAKITGLKLKITADIDVAGLANVYFRYGFGNGSSISQNLIDEYKFPGFNPYEIPSGGVTITSYLNSNMSPFSLKRNYGDYLTFYFQTSNILSKTMAVESVVLEITYEIPTYTVTTVVSPTSSGTVTGGGSYANGKTATLTATPTTGYKFVKWNDGVTTASRTVTVSGNATYTAYFEKLKHSVEISYDSNAGTVTGAVSGEYEYGTKLTLTAVPKAGYSFESWVFDYFHDTSVNLMDNPITFTVLGEECVFARMFVNTNIYRSDGISQIVHKGTKGLGEVAAYKSKNKIYG